MERWLIELSDAQLEQLPQEQRELGTLIRAEDGRCYLVFRDGFVALKVASGLGLKRNPARSVPAETATQLRPLAQLEGGKVLVADPA